MRILFLGDVVGCAGRDVVREHVPRLRDELELDVVIINGENAAHGFGITEKNCKEFYDAGADVVTTGNHAWDQREILDYIDSDPRLLRPANYPPGTPGAGLIQFETAAGARVVVAQVMGRLFMDPLDDPFAVIDGELAPFGLGAEVQAIIVEMHAEATSEKMAMGHHLDGRVSMVVGAHTHVPTADAQILPGGTGYQTDLGMCGDYDSVIGMKKGAAIQRFTTKLPTERLAPADGEATLCAVWVETDDATGLARHISPLRIGGRLAPQMPGEWR